MSPSAADRCSWARSRRRAETSRCQTPRDHPEEIDLGRESASPSVTVSAVAKLDASSTYALLVRKQGGRFCAITKGSATYERGRDEQGWRECSGFLEPYALALLCGMTRLFGHSSARSRDDWQRHRRNACGAPKPRTARAGQSARCRVQPRQSEGAAEGRTRSALFCSREWTDPPCAADDRAADGQPPVRGLLRGTSRTARRRARVDHPECPDRDPTPRVPTGPPSSDFVESTGCLARRACCSSRPHAFKTRLRTTCCSLPRSPSTGGIDVGNTLFTVTRRDMSSASASSVTSRHFADIDRRPSSRLSQQRAKRSMTAPARPRCE